MITIFFIIFGCENFGKNGVKAGNDFQKIQLTLENVDGNTFTCTDDLITYTMDVSNIENKDDFAVGDKLNIFYSSITYENNIGKISVFYIEKM